AVFYRGSLVGLLAADLVHYRRSKDSPDRRAHWLSRLTSSALGPNALRKVWHILRRVHSAKLRQARLVCDRWSAAGRSLLWRRDFETTRILRSRVHLNQAGPFEIHCASQKLQR